jgi:hypothetical protein
MTERRAAPSLEEFLLLSWRTSVQALQAVVDGQDLPRPKQMSGTVRQQDYGLLIQFQGGKYPPELFAQANQKAIQSNWKKIEALSAYKWLEANDSFKTAYDKALIGRGTGDGSRRVCFVHVVAMAMAAYQIERTESSQFPQVDKRVVASALSTSKKLRGLVAELRSLDRNTELIEHLLRFELVLGTYHRGRGKKRDETYPHRIFVKGLLQGFKHYFDDPMVGIAEELCAVVEYSADRSMLMAQWRSITAEGDGRSA